LRLKNARRSLPTTFNPYPNSDRKSAAEKEKLGRHGLAAHSAMTEMLAWASCCPTSAQAPYPISAIAIPITPLSPIARSFRAARLRKSISRRSRPIWMLLRATRTKTRERAWRMGSSRWSPSSPARGAASSAPARARITPVTIATQKAVSSSRRVSVGRWITASPRPWSTKSCPRPTNTAASATRPKSTGWSRRESIAKMTSPSSWLPHVSTSVHMSPRATRLRKLPSRPCCLGVHVSAATAARV
jgi:hypothetical protein